jgi:hypothetical protein
MELALALLSLPFGMAAVWIVWQDHLRPARAGGPAEEADAPKPLQGSAATGFDALRPNVFPRQHDTPCSNCNGRVLVWTQDGARPDAWVGVCRRCGFPRLDVVEGETIER